MSWTVKWTSLEETKTHGTFPTFAEALNSIYDWWDVNDFTPHYVRTIGNPEVDDRVDIDYGLHFAKYRIAKNEVKDMSNDDFIAQAVKIVGLKEQINPDKVFVVWVAKILKNNKGLFASPDSDKYYEITLDGEKQKFYVDTYDKVSNEEIGLAVRHEAD